MYNMHEASPDTDWDLTKHFLGKALVVALYAMILGFVFAALETAYALTGFKYKQLLAALTLGIISFAVMFVRLPKLKGDYDSIYIHNIYESPILFYWCGWFVIGKDVVFSPIINWIISLI